MQKSESIQARNSLRKVTNNRQKSWCSALHATAQGRDASVTKAETQQALVACALLTVAMLFCGSPPADVQLVGHEERPALAAQLLRGRPRRQVERSARSSPTALARRARRTVARLCSDGDPADVQLVGHKGSPDPPFFFCLFFCCQMKKI